VGPDPDAVATEQQRVPSLRDLVHMEGEGSEGSEEEFFVRKVDK
jgi:hypothetical protein